MAAAARFRRGAGSKCRSRTETSIEVKGGFCSIDGDVVTVAADCVGDEIDRQDSRHEAELQIAALRVTDDEDLD